MAPPTKLAISTSSVLRLIKDRESYQKEEGHQENRIKQLESQTTNDENAGYMLKQERRALEETRAMFPDLKQRILEASRRLEQQLSDDQASSLATDEEIVSAKDALQMAKLSEKSP